MKLTSAVALTITCLWGSHLKQATSAAVRGAGQTNSKQEHRTLAKFPDIFGPTEQTFTVDETGSYGCSSAPFSTSASTGGTADANSRVQILEFAAAASGTAIDCVLSCAPEAGGVQIVGGTDASGPDTALSSSDLTATSGSRCPISMGLKTTANEPFYLFATAQFGFTDATVQLRQFV